HRGLEAMHDHAEGVADQDHIAIAIDQARRMSMIGGEAHDRLATLAGADVGCGEPFDLLLDRHGSTPEYRHADDPRMEPEATNKMEEGAGNAKEEVVAKPPACRDDWRRSICAALERDAIVDGPAQDRAEQDDRAEIAIGNEVRHRPQLHADQHRML